MGADWGSPGAPYPWGAAGSARAEAQPCPVHVLRLPCPGPGPAATEPLRSGVCRQAWQGLTPKPHAPFDGVGPTSPNLKRHPGLSVRPGSIERRWPRTPCAGSSRRRRGSACRGSRLPFGSPRSHPRVPGTPCSPLRGSFVPWDPAVTPAGGARCGPAPAVRCKRERGRR